MCIYEIAMVVMNQVSNKEFEDACALLMEQNDRDIVVEKEDQFLITHVSI